jgi:hypothetical protein
LCDKCEEKWVFGHKCAASVQLHAIQELWELLPEEDQCSENSDSSRRVDTTSQLCVCLFDAAMTGKESAKSMKMLGSIQGHSIVVFVDSGSSHTFVNSSLACQLSGVSALAAPLSVQVANGINI